MKIDEIKYSNDLYSCKLFKTLLVVILLFVFVSCSQSESKNSEINDNESLSEENSVGIVTINKYYWTTTTTFTTTTTTTWTIMTTTTTTTTTTIQNNTDNYNVTEILSILNLLSGLEPDISIENTKDINSDDCIGLEETIYLIQKCSAITATTCVPFHK